MTIEQIRDMVSGKDYDFLRENEHLGDRWRQLFIRHKCRNV